MEKIVRTIQMLIPVIHEVIRIIRLLKSSNSISNTEDLITDLEVTAYNLSEKHTVKELDDMLLLIEQFEQAKTV